MEPSSKCCYHLQVFEEVGLQVATLERDASTEEIPGGRVRESMC